MNYRTPAEIFVDQLTNEEWVSYSPTDDDAAWRIVINKAKAQEFLKFIEQYPEANDALRVLTNWYVFFKKTSHK